MCSACILVRMSLPQPTTIPTAILLVLAVGTQCFGNPVAGQIPSKSSAMSGEGSNAAGTAAVSPASQAAERDPELGIALCGGGEDMETAGKLRNVRDSRLAAEQPLFCRLCLEGKPPGSMHEFWG